MKKKTQMSSAESPTSRFTPVNNSSIKELLCNTDSIVASNSNANTNSIGGPKRDSEERIVGGQSRASHGQEKLTHVTTNSLDQKEDWSTSRERNIFLPPPKSNNEKDPLQRQKQPILTSKNEVLEDSNSSSSKQVLNLLVRPTEPDFVREEGLRQELQLDSREAYLSDSQFRHYPTPIEEHEPPAQSSEAWNMRYYTQQAHLTSDEQIGQVLQLASQNVDAHSSHHHSTSPYGAPSGSDKVMEQNLKSHSQPEAKKRKRNFSSRTKTGCMTCRTRKKKCDEAKPECNNCLRGGFLCSGYPPRGGWPKNEQKSKPVRLKAKKKDSENSPCEPGNLYISTNSGENQQQSEPLSGYRGQSLRVDAQQDQLATKGNDSSYRPSSQMPTPITATNYDYPDRCLKSAYEQVVPFHDYSPQESKADHHPDLDPHTNPQIAAQLALSNMESASYSSYPEPSNEEISNGPSQKEEMIAGRHYYPFDKQLILERENCKDACWRFNSSSNPNSGISPGERVRLFRDILQPDHVGHNIIVEPPFSCDYGYNITVGEDVIIGRNCTILDSCEVKIGDRCHIGPNVNIYTTSLPIDPKKRLGAKGPQFGKKVLIENDCWIGGGAIILPGRTIGKGATVGAGSVVTKDVPPYTVVRGNPAHILRVISTTE